MPDDRCSYCCAVKASVWCDAPLAKTRAAPAAEQLLIGETPAPRSERVRVETCDVGACPTCAKRYGWRRVGGVVVCGRRRGRGCSFDSLDHCHAHAGGGASPSPLLDAAALAALRAQLRDACRAMEKARRGHTCHARGCDAPCEPRYLMCGRHWRMVPESIAAEVWRTYRPGQEVDKRPSAAWVRAADAAIGAVALVEGVEVTARQAVAAFDLGFRHERLDPRRVEVARVALARST